MTQLSERLESLQCGCDDLQGKRIIRAIRRRGYYYLLFENGQWCHTDYQRTVGEILESLQECDPIDDPFVEFGLASFEDITKHWIDDRAEWEENLKAARLREYEELKEEFDGGAPEESEVPNDQRK